jgi:hypothetical protein
MAKTSGETKYPNRDRKTSDVETEREVNVNAQPNHMIDNRIENPSGPALLVRQPSELTIRVIKNIRDHVEKHSGQIDGNCLIEIKMAGDDAEQPADKSDGRRREVQSRKKSRQTETDPSVKEKIDNSLKLARFISRIDLRLRL